MVHSAVAHDTVVRSAVAHDTVVRSAVAHDTVVRSAVARSDQVAHGLGCSLGAGLAGGEPARYVNSPPSGTPGVTAQ